MKLELPKTQDFLDFGDRIDLLHDLPLWKFDRLFLDLHLRNLHNLNAVNNDPLSTHGNCGFAMVSTPGISNLSKNCTSGSCTACTTGPSTTASVRPSSSVASSRTSSRGVSVLCGTGMSTRSTFPSLSRPTDAASTSSDECRKRQQRRRRYGQDAPHQQLAMQAGQLATLDSSAESSELEQKWLQIFVFLSLSC